MKHILPVIQNDVPKHALGIAQSIKLIVIYYGLSITMSSLLPLDVASASLIVNFIAWPITIWLGLRWHRISFSEAFPLKHFPVRIVPALLIVSFGADILIAELTRLTPMLEALSIHLNARLSSSNKTTLFIAFVLISPVAEECFFRGLLLRGYLGRYPVIKAVWASSIVFALFHLNPLQAVAALPLALGCAWLCLRTGSLLPGILTHMAVNFSTLFLLKPL